MKPTDMPAYGNIGPFPATMVLELPIRDSRQIMSEMLEEAERVAESLALSRLYPIHRITSRVDHERRIVRVEVTTEVCDYDEV